MPFDDPFRLRVQKGICEALADIKKAEGFKNDLAGKVFRGRVRFGDRDPLPLISLLEPSLPEEIRDNPEADSLNASEWMLVIQGWVEDDFANPTDPAHILMADVKQKLVAEKRRDYGEDIFGMGGAVTSLEIGPGVVRPPDQTSDKAYFWLTISLGLVEDLHAPYD